MMAKRVVKDRSGAGMPTEHVEGVNYFDYDTVPDFGEQMRLVKNMTVRPDDVFAGGYPKSGHHWAYELIHMVLRQNTEVEPTKMYEFFLEYFGPVNFDNYFESVPSPRVMMSHLRLCRLPKQIFEQKPRLIYIIRNPKDMLVSGYHFWTSLIGNYKYSGNWSDFLDMNLRGEFPPGSWFDHVKSADKFMEDNPDLPVHLFVYEKMKEDPVEEVRKLCQFLDRPVTKAEEIAHAIEFHNIRPKMYKVKMETVERNFCRSGKEVFLRKGIVGDWKNHFSEEENEHFNQIFKEKMAGSRLGDLVRPYIEC